MTTPQRFPKGVTNVESGKTLDQLLIPDPTSLHQFIDDFDKFVPGDWLITRVTDSSATTEGSEAIQDEIGGVLKITLSNADDDSCFLQMKGSQNVTTASEVFKLVSGKKTWFKCRVAVSDIDATDFLIGLQAANTTPLTPANGVFFRSDDGDANLDFHVYASSVAISSNSAIATMADATYAVLGFYFNGGGTIEYYVNDVLFGSVETTSFPTTEMTLTFGVQNGAAAAKTMSIDYIFVGQER